MNFIVQQICHANLEVDRSFIERLHGYLTMEKIENETLRMHNDRENAWYELLMNNYLQDISNYDEQLNLARKACCYHVEEYLLEKLERFEEILSCHIKNPSRHYAMFSYIDCYVRSPERLILKQVLMHLNILLDIDAKEIIRLIILHYREHLDIIWDQLLNEATNNEIQEIRLLKFLRNLYDCGELKNRQYAQKCLELLCKYDVDAVDLFLRQNDSYLIEDALALLRDREDFLDSCVYLAEKQGDHRLAFDFAMKKLKMTNNESSAAECIRTLCDICAHYSKLPVKRKVSESREISTGLATMIDLTESTTISKQLVVEESQKLWFEMLEYVLQRHDLKSITKSLLQEASSYVNLQHLVQLVLNIRHVSGNFGDIKDLLMGMLLQSRQEMCMMEETLRIMGRELSQQFYQARKTCRQGIWVTMMRCILCSQRLLNQSTSVGIALQTAQNTNILILGTCGHGMHEQCFWDYRKIMQDLLLIKDNKQQKSPNTSNDVNDGDQNKDCEDFQETFRCPNCFFDLKFHEIENPINLAQCCDKYKPNDTTIYT